VVWRLEWVARGLSALHHWEGAAVDNGGTSIFGPGGLYCIVCTGVEGEISLGAKEKQTGQIRYALVRGPFMTLPQQR
jgi:hypothetical protein